MLFKAQVETQLLSLYTLESVPYRREAHVLQLEIPLHHHKRRPSPCNEDPAQPNFFFKYKLRN